MCDRLPCIGGVDPAAVHLAGASLSGSHAENAGLSYYLDLLKEGPAIAYYVVWAIGVGVMARVLWLRGHD